MSDPADLAATSAPRMIPPTIQQQPPLLRLGGGLGIAACSIGILILLASCLGYGFAMLFSFLPIIMGAVGFIVSIVGGVRDQNAEGSHMVAALFINFAAIAGGAMEWWAWQHWPKA